MTESALLASLGVAWKAARPLVRGSQGFNPPLGILGSSWALLGALQALLGPLGALLGVLGAFLIALGLSGMVFGRLLVNFRQIFSNISSKYRCFFEICIYFSKFGA